MSIFKLGVSFAGAKIANQKTEEVIQDKSYQEMLSAQQRMMDGMQAAKDNLDLGSKFGDDGGNGLMNELSDRFGYHSRGTPDYVVTDENILLRMSGAPKDIKEVLHDALERRDAQEKRLNTTVKQEKLERLVGNSLEAEAMAQRAKIQKMLVNAQNTELNVAFFFGPNIDEFDSRNPDGARTGFRTDIETQDFMVEVTIGKKKDVYQLDDYVYAKTVRQDLIMYAPNMEQGWVDRHVSSRGFHHVRNFGDLSTIIQRLRR